MNYIKSVCTLAGILLAAAMGTGCSDPNALEQLCDETGGKYENDRCVCNGQVCDANMVCTAGGSCPGSAEIPDVNALEKLCAQTGGSYKDNRCSCSGDVCDVNTVCDADKKCSSKPATNPNQINALEQLCTETGGTYKDNRCTCNGDVCDANMVCTEEGKCPVILSSTCEPKVKKCSASATYECVKDLGWSQVEKCDKGCADDGKKCAQCFETSCKDGVLTQCNDNIATTIKCEHGCNDAANDCKPECEAGQIKCDGKDRLECNPDTLTWQSVEKCSFACEIDKSNKTRCIDDCEHGATRCEDGKISTCIDKIWSQPVACEFNGVCQNAEKCVECTIDDPENPPKRCFNDVNGVAHIQVCNGETYEDELIPEDSSDPDSKKIPNVSADGYSCKENEIAFGNCNNLAGAFCENRINADNQGRALGIMYTCKDGVKVEDKKCWDPADYTTKVSCNADKTGCGECINYDSNACKNGSDGVGIVTKCIDGEYQDVSCERGFACRDDGISCKQCRYNANIRDNEMLCTSNNRVQIMVCSENGSWELPKECKPDLNVDRYDKQCRKGTSDYHDYCPGGY